MNEIPFISALGDAIESATADRGAAIAGPGRERLRWRRLRPARRRLILAIAAVAMAGGGAYAATQQNAMQLATGGLACYAGTGTSASAYFDVEASGRSPQAACAAVFRTSAPDGRRASAGSLIACASPHGYVAVFDADGSGGQCTRAGMKPLAQASYAAASTRVHALVRALGSLTSGDRCVPVPALLREVRRELARFGWSGWTAAVRPRSVHGGCGRFEATGASRSDPAASLDSTSRKVWIVSTPA